MRRYQPTRYELVAKHVETGRQILIAYSMRRSRRTLYECLRQRLDHLLPVLGSAEIQWGKRAADGLRLGQYHIHYTGRTQRDCEGREHPFIADLAKGA